MKILISAHWAHARTVRDARSPQSVAENFHAKARATHVKHVKPGTSEIRICTAREQFDTQSPQRFARVKERTFVFVICIVCSEA